MPDRDTEFTRLARRIVARLNADDRICIANGYLELSTRTVRERIEAIATLLQEKTAPGACVGVRFENSPAQALAILACLVAGRAPFVINPRTFSTPPSPAMNSIQYLIAGRQSAVVPGLFLEETGEITDVIDGSPDWDKAKVESSTALVLETSGTSGQPKAVEVSARSLNYLIDYLIGYLGLNTDSRALVLHPLCHTFALNSQFLPTLLAGGSIHFIDPKFSLGEILRETVSTQASFLTLVSSAIDYLGRETRGRGQLCAPAVRQVQIAGETIRTRHLELARQLFPNARIFKAYGLTEALRVAMISSDEDEFASDTVGHPLPDHEIQIRQESGQPASENETGEIWVKGPTVMNRLRNATTDTIGSDRFDQNGFLRTGDLGRIRNGHLHIDGRADQCFKKDGIKVIPSTIEAIACRTEGVSAASCIGIVDENANTQVVLFVESAETNATALERQLRAGLPRPLVPSAIFLMTQIPRGTAGKVRYSELNQLWRRRDSLRIIPSSGRSVFFSALGAV